MSAAGNGSEARGLAFEGVALELGGRPVLRDVSFEIAPGEVVGLLGRNGAGKTSLLRLATRVLDPGAGRVLFAGRELAHYSRRQIARLHAGFDLLGPDVGHEPERDDGQDRQQHGQQPTRVRVMVRHVGSIGGLP